MANFPATSLRPLVLGSATLAKTILGAHGRVMTVDDMDAVPTTPLKTRDTIPPGPFLDVVNRLPLIGGRVWLCGGAVRRYEEGGYAQMDGDWDLFLAKSVKEEELHELLIPQGATFMLGKSRPGTLEWDLPTPHGIAKVQAITFRRFTSATAAMSMFDFTINQAAVILGINDVPKIVSHMDWEKDVPDRVLRPASPQSLAGLLKRTQKFIQMGYFMPPEVILEHAKRLSRLPAGESGEDYFELPEGALL